MSDFFNKEAAQNYDSKNSKLNRISDTLHFLTSLVLTDVPPKARVLCVGVGTGAELLALARIYPEWTFVGLDPSQEMLNVCRERVKAEGLESRCELFHGLIQDLPSQAPFDAVLSILVAHFINAKAIELLQHMTSHCAAVVISSMPS